MNDFSIKPSVDLNEFFEWQKQQQQDVSKVESFYDYLDRYREQAEVFLREMKEE